MYALLSHDSACEALRFLSVRSALPAKRLPSVAQKLLGDQCVSTQREYRQLCEKVDLASLGVRTAPTHLLVPSQQMRSSGRSAHFHVWSAELPANSCLQVVDDVLLSGPEFTIMQFAGATARLDELLNAHAAAIAAEAKMLAGLGLEDHATVDNPLAWEHERRIVAAAVLACEFAGTYRLGMPGESTRYRTSPIMSCDGLEHMAAKAERTTAASRASKAARLAFDGSASPMETALALLFALPVEYGGLGLPRPVLNAPVDVPGYRGVLSDRDQVSPDFFWPEKRVALEYDSGEFHFRGEKAAGTDAVRANILTALGYRVFRATPQTVRSLAAVELLGRQLACALGVVLEIPDEICALRRRRLYAELMPHRREG